MASDDAIKKAIPANVYMLSLSGNSKVSADSNKLPDPGSKHGGIFTSAFLRVCNDEKHQERMTWSSFLKSMQSNLNEREGAGQSPHLSCSRPLDMEKPALIFPRGSKGKKRAILIGINYVGQKGELKSCHKAIQKMKHYLVKAQGFQEDDVLILSDDKVHLQPTCKNIKQAFLKLAQSSRAGDAAFIHFAGHGGRLLNKSGAYEETLIPIDFESSRQISGEFLVKNLIKPMKSKTELTIAIDCCHNGDIVDLPYQAEIDGDSQTKIPKDYEMPKSFLSGQDISWECTVCLGNICGFVMLASCAGCCDACMEAIQ